MKKPRLREGSDFQAGVGGSHSEGGAPKPVVFPLQTLEQGRHCTCPGLCGASPCSSMKEAWAGIITCFFQMRRLRYRGMD